MNIRRFKKRKKNILMKKMAKDYRYDNFNKLDVQFCEPLD